MPRGKKEWAGAVVLLLFVVSVVVAVILGTARDRRAATPGPANWVPLGGPNVSVGGGTVWTRCDGYTRLYLTLGADGFPAGQVVQVPHEQGSRCDP